MSKPYKQLIRNSRQHAREAAIVLATFKAKVLLGPQQPSIENF
jgi:primosomal protein N'